MFVEIENVIGTSDVAIAQLRLELGGKVYYAEGWSKRDPMDRPDKKLAQMLALGRAMENLSKKVLSEANGLIKHHDDLREQMPLQRQKSKEWHDRQAKAKKTRAKRATKKASA